MFNRKVVKAVDAFAAPIAVKATICCVDFENIQAARLPWSPMDPTILRIIDASAAQAFASTSLADPSITKHTSTRHAAN